MDGETIDPASNEQRAIEAIAAYLEAADAGHAIEPREFIAQHSDIAAELAEFFQDRAQFERMAEPIQAVLGGALKEPRPVAGAGVFNDLRAGRFGDYELLEELGRGGMGVVYKARQISLGRVVALKMILSGSFASAEDVRRFQTEAAAAANLDHPGIVPVYEVGEHDGRHFFAMGFIEGQSLAARMATGPIPAREAAELLKQVCEAIQCAHEHGVIHRDLKPANILLDIRPRITDFGLAKCLKLDSALTGTGQVLGTPSYMSPEQATGATHRIGPASDIYSLGAILYQLLTGRPPFQAETPLETLSQVLDSDPVPPRLLNRNVPRDLEAISMKCLDKSPALRYASARELGDDLQRYLDGETVHAASVNLLDRVTRALRQSRHEEHFRGWGLGLMAFGLVILLSHVAIFFMEQTWQDPLLVYWLPRVVMFAALLVMLWRFRGSVLPTGAAERLVWAVWLGYVAALGAVNAVRLVLGGDQRESYAWFAILTGLGFLVMGAHIWGGGYAIGLIFMMAAPLLATYLDVAPLAFGILWAAGLIAFGLHYWLRGRAA